MVVNPLPFARENESTSHRPPEPRRAPAFDACVAGLLDFDFGAGFFEFLLDGLGFFLRHAFFDGFRAAGADMADPSSFAGWMQDDGIHPNAEGVGLIIATLGPQVQELLSQVAK